MRARRGAAIGAVIAGAIAIGGGAGGRAARAGGDVTDGAAASGDASGSASGDASGSAGSDASGSAGGSDATPAPTPTPGGPVFGPDDNPGGDDLIVLHPRPLHGSLGVGAGGIVGGNDRTGLAAALDVLPGGNFGVWGATLAVHDLASSPFGRRGLATLGVIREAAAARPLLAILLHGDVGVAWGDKTLPAVGGGVKTYLALLGSLGVGLDVTLHVEIDGGDSKAMVGFTLLVAAMR